MKGLCKIKKSHRQKDLASYINLVNAPTHVCGKCGRVANKKKMLCKPISMK